MTHDRIQVFDIEKDLAADKVLKAVRKGSTRENGEVLFDPDMWKGKGDELKFDNSRLSDDELREYATLATGIRQKFKARADAIEEARRESDSV